MDQKKNSIHVSVKWSYKNKAYTVLKYFNLQVDLLQRLQNLHYE